jgi:hypothetical protein
MALPVQALSSYSASVSAYQTTSDFAVLLRTATMASALVLAGLPSQSYAKAITRQDKNSLLAQRLVTEGTFAHQSLVALDPTKAFHAAVTAFAMLRDFETAHPSLSAQIADARTFVATLPSNIDAPQIWTDGEGEILFEWIKGNHHAAVSFEGDGEFGYALRLGSRFVPGTHNGRCGGMLPIDLLRYLAEI